MAMGGAEKTKGCVDYLHDILSSNLTSVFYLLDKSIVTFESK
jgi:hypothetical protein